MIKFMCDKPHDAVMPEHEAEYLVKPGKDGKAEDVKHTCTMHVTHFVTTMLKAKDASCVIVRLTK